MKSNAVECAIGIEMATNGVRVEGDEDNVPEFGRDELQADK
jgi:hypothetical protein